MHYLTQELGESVSCVAATGLRGQQSVEGHLTKPLEKVGH